MASPAAASVFLLLVGAFAAGASAATFTVTNNCGFTVWPAAIPVGGGAQLDPGQSWSFDAPPAPPPTGDCGGALSCSLSGQPPTTLAEYTIGGVGGAQDFYDLSVIDGYNVAMGFSCSSGVSLQ
ncbi:hypothetical protein ACP70R_032259 [Stipagrostis hirtigluma subsp. patula]